MKIHSLLATGLLILAGCRTQGNQARGASVDLIGHPFPTFAFASLPGRDSVRSRDLSGSVSMVVFWATWCEPCREEVGTLKELLKLDGPGGLKIVGLSVDDSPAAVPLLVNRLEIPYPVGVGANTFFDGLKLEDLPQSFVLDANGVVRDAFTGAADLPTLHRAIALAHAPRSL